MTDPRNPQDDPAPCDPESAETPPPRPTGENGAPPEGIGGDLTWERPETPVFGLDPDAQPPAEDERPSGIVGRHTPLPLPPVPPPVPAAVPTSSAASHQYPAPPQAPPVFGPAAPPPAHPHQGSEWQHPSSGQVPQQPYGQQPPSGQYPQQGYPPQYGGYPPQDPSQQSPSGQYPYGYPQQGYPPPQGYGYPPQYGQQPYGYDPNQQAPYGGYYQQNAVDLEIRKKLTLAGWSLGIGFLLVLCCLPIGLAGGLTAMISSRQAMKRAKENDRDPGWAQIFFALSILLLVIALALFGYNMYMLIFERDQVNQMMRDLGLPGL